MSDERGGDDPPGSVWFSLDEALTLLAVLEDAWDGLLTAGYLTVVVAIEAQIDLLVRRLHLDPPEGGDGDR